MEIHNNSNQKNLIDNLIKSDFTKAPKKILFACVAADGHFNPLTSLAAYLKEQGNDVRWYTSPSYSEKIAKLGIKHYPFKKALNVTADNVDEIFPERKKISGKVKKLVFDLIQGFILRAPEYYEDIKEIHNSFQFDVVIADCMFFAIPFIKNKLNIPVISVGVVPLTESSKDIAPQGLGLTPPENFLVKMKYRVLNFLITRAFKEPTKLLQSILQQYGIRMTVPNIFDYITRESSLLLQIGTPGFEYKRRDLSSNIRFIGALLPQFNNTKTWHHPKLFQYRKILLVTQGTVEKDISKLITPTLTAFKNTEYLVVVTTGGSHTNKLREQFNYDNVIIEDFIPFPDIMPMADVCITNGGYGGIMFSINNKLPMVVAGIHEGKSEINARVGHFKIGINLRTENPTPLQIKSAVEKVLANDMYKQNVTGLAKEFSRYNAGKLCTACINELLEKQQHSNFTTIKN